MQPPMHPLPCPGCMPPALGAVRQLGCLEVTWCCVQADHELSGSVVSKVLEAMDVHGRLTLDEFLAIADVSAWLPDPQSIMSGLGASTFEMPLRVLCFDEGLVTSNPSAAALLSFPSHWCTC